MADDETGVTVVDVHQVVRDLSGNILVDQMVQHVYSIQDGLIERMDIRSRESDGARKLKQTGRDDEPFGAPGDS